MLMVMVGVMVMVLVLVTTRRHYPSGRVASFEFSVSIRTMMTMWSNMMPRCGSCMRLGKVW
jgi:hypothetical protein